MKLSLTLLVIFGLVAFVGAAPVEEEHNEDENSTLEELDVQEDPLFFQGRWTRACRVYLVRNRASGNKYKCTQCCSVKCGRWFRRIRFRKPYYACSGSGYCTKSCTKLSKPTSKPKPGTTQKPEPATTEGPEQVTTKGPEPATTEEPEPATTEGPEPATTEGPEPAKTEGPEPVTTKEPEQVTTQEPEPVTTQEPEPVTTEGPEPATTQKPELVTTAMIGNGTKIENDEIMSLVDKLFAKQAEDL